jgi:hypothetical protein
MLTRKKKELIEAHAEWLSRYGWNWFGTLTFPGHPSAQKARKKFDQWISAIKKEVGGRNFRYAAAMEFGAYKDNAHFHVLVGGIRKEHKRWPSRWAARWQDIAGYAAFGDFDPKRGGIRYLLKSLWPDGDFELIISLPNVGKKGRSPR